MSTGESLFPEVPRNAAGHFALHLFAAHAALTSYVARLADDRGERVADAFAEYPFLMVLIEDLRGHMSESVPWYDAPIWWRDAVTAWERGIESHLPLRAISAVTGADFGARVALLLTALVEQDVRFGSLYAGLQHPIASRRPCVGLLREIVAGLSGADPVAPWLGRELLQVEDRSIPRAEWTLRVDLELWDLVHGWEAVLPRGVVRRAAEGAPVWTTVLDELEDSGALRELPALLARADAPVVVLRGSGGSGRRRLLAAAAAAAGRGLLEVTVDAERRVRPEALRGLELACSLRGDVPLVVADLGPGESMELGSLAGHAGAVCVALKMEGALAGVMDREVLSLDMPEPTAVARERLWRDELGRSLAGVEPVELANTIRLPLEHARRTARTARESARLEGRSTVTRDDLRHAARALGVNDLDRLATRVPARGSWDDLVTSREARHELELVEERCRLGRSLDASLGVAFQNVAQRGQKILVHGPSGVGKSLSIRILAARLGKDLYVADLGALVDKWVGESEKAVSRLLAAAEERDVVLLIDEGDSLLSPRTPVRGASEKYSNLLTNHFLTRLEGFSGVLAVTTNALNRTDDAFLRRFDAVVALSRPDALQRESIFALHLPRDHAVEGRALAALALRAHLSGGQIRNAVLHAAQLAAARGPEERLVLDELRRGVRRELHKAGWPGAHGEPAERGTRRLVERFLESRE